MNRLRFAPACRTALGAVAVLILVLARPTSSFAQTVTSANLIGTWARQGEKEVDFTFRTDSTLTRVIKTNVGAGIGKGHWHLVSDTLVVSDFVVVAKGKTVKSDMDRRVVTIKDKLLTMTRVDAGQGMEQGPETRVYERVDSLTVNPPKP